MYHRVAREVHDPWGLAVTPSDFEEQIAYLKKQRSAMSLKELIHALRNRTLPRDAIAVTFDDGYRDNLVNASPVLLRHQVPATLFVATGYTSRKKLFWWDELAAVTLASSTRVDSFLVRGLADIRFEWGDPERADISGSWRAWTEPVTARQRCYIAAWQRLRQEKADDRDTAMAQLRQSLSIPPQDLAMPMEESELREISAGGVIHLGAHTVTHPSLPGIEKGERRKEIEKSREECQRFTSNRVNEFAYPFGDLNEDVRNEVAGLNFSCACTTEPGFLDGNIDVFRLPRISVQATCLERFIGSIIE